jgi:hypothetical protein
LIRANRDRSLRKVKEVIRQMHPRASQKNLVIDLCEDEDESQRDVTAPLPPQSAKSGFTSRDALSVVPVSTTNYGTNYAPVFNPYAAGDMMAPPRAPGACKKWPKADTDVLVNLKKNDPSLMGIDLASKLPGRTKVQCNSRLKYLKESEEKESVGACTGKWTEAEDACLKIAVMAAIQCGTGGKVDSWNSVAEKVKGRDEAQCRLKWKYFLKKGKK